MKLTSPAFDQNQRMHRRHSREGGNVSPPLEWSFVPDSCRSFALFCQDPDVPKRLFREFPFVHWLAYNIPGNVSGLPEGIPSREKAGSPFMVTQGKNSLGRIGYCGPMPPEGHGPHHYLFTLFALDADLNLEPGLKREFLIKQMESHCALPKSSLK
jgi:Raf kinase inhibitor-like YbhB/YbcL family protein